MKNLMNVKMVLVSVKEGKTKDNRVSRNLTMECDDVLYSFFTTDSFIIEKINTMKKYKQYEIVLELGAYQTKAYVKLNDVVIS